MAILAPFILQRVYKDLEPGKSLRKSILSNHERSATFVGRQLVELWVSVARVNHLVFQDFVDGPQDYHHLAYYIARERELFLDVGKFVPGFEKATPNFHIGIHIPHQIWLCTLVHLLV
jgi:hypothetical protein